MIENKIGKSEKYLWYFTLIVLPIVCILDFSCPCFSKHYGFVFTIIYNLTVGCLSALIILYFQRQDRIKKLEEIYLKEIAGTYKRDYIHEPTSGHNEKLKTDNVDKLVELSYLGGHLIKVETVYWGEKVEGIIEFSENSQFVGSGIFRYIDSIELDIGTYKIQRFPDQLGKLYAYYENTIPKNGSSGYEIWIKQ